MKLLGQRFFSSNSFVLLSAKRKIDLLLLITNVRCNNVLTRSILYDKGEGTVIMDRDVYIRKILEIIKDHTKFKELSTDPAILREGQLQRFLRSMKDKNIFTEQTYEKNISLIYGTPKIHKLKHNNVSDLSLRPIISSIGNYNYSLAKFFSSLLKPVISAMHCTKDSFSFCEEIRKVKANNRFLVFMIVVVY